MDLREQCNWYSRRIKQNDLRVAVVTELETLENWGRLDEAGEE